MRECETGIIDIESVMGEAFGAWDPPLRYGKGVAFWKGCEACRITSIQKSCWSSFLLVVRSAHLYIMTSAMRLHTNR